MAAPVSVSATDVAANDPLDVNDDGKDEEGKGGAGRGSEAAGSTGA